MKFLRRSASQKDLRQNEDREIDEINTQYANKSEDMLSSVAMNRGSLLWNRSKTPTGRQTPDNFDPAMIVPDVHRSHELDTVRETLEFEEDGLTFSFPTPQLSPPRESNSRRPSLAFGEAITTGPGYGDVHNQQSMWARPMKPDLPLLRQAQSSMSTLAAAKSNTNQQDTITALPAIRKKKSGWNTFSSLFKRSSRQLAQEPFYKLQTGSDQDMQEQMHAETPRYIPSPNPDSRAPSRQQVDYYNSKPLPSPSLNGSRANTPIGIPLNPHSRLRNTSTESNAKSDSTKSMTNRERNDSLLEYREVKWPSARKRQGNRNNTTQLSHEAPVLLDIDIPGSPIMKERYSVMFGSLLSASKRDSAEQKNRISMHERKRSRSMNGGFVKPDLQLPAQQEEQRQSKLFLVPQAYRNSEDEKDKENTRPSGTRQGWLKKMASTPILKSKISLPSIPPPPVPAQIPPVPKMITVPYTSSTACDPPRSQPPIPRPPSKVTQKKLPSLPLKYTSSPSKRQHIAACARTSPIQTPKRPKTASSPDSNMTPIEMPAIPTIKQDTSYLESIKGSQKHESSSPTFLASDSGSDYGDDDDAAWPIATRSEPDTSSPKSVRTTCFYDDDGFLVEDTAARVKPLSLTKRRSRIAKPTTPTGCLSPVAQNPWPPKRKPVHHSRQGSAVRHARQVSITRAPPQVMRHEPLSRDEMRSQHRYSHYRQDSDHQMAVLESWVEQQSEAVFPPENHHTHTYKSEPDFP